MKTEKGKLIKVTLEYENTKESLSDEEARRWLDMINGMCVLAQVRNQNPFETAKFKWIKEEIKN